MSRSWVLKAIDWEVIEFIDAPVHPRTWIETAKVKPARIANSYQNMSTLMSLPAELVCYIGSYLLMPDLGHYAMSRRFISACCTKRVKRHNDVLQFAKQRTWTGWKTDGQDPSRYTVSAPDWLDFLIALLEKKELSWYVESISFDCVESPTWENERTKLKAQLGTREKNIIRDALIKMPWFKQQDPTFVALWIETDPSLRFRPFSNIKLPKRWLFLVMIL